MHNRGLKRGSIRILAVLTLLLATIGGVTGGAVVAAQEVGLIDETTYVVEATGDEIVWGDPWDFDDEISDTGDGFEIVALNAELSSLLISVLPNGLDIEESRDIVLEEFAAGTDQFATIDRGAYENISYSLDLANVGGTELGAFTLFRGGTGNTPTFAYIFIGSIQGFSDGFASSQQEITIAGDPIFDGVDGEGLQALLEANEGAALGAEVNVETPAAEDEETPQPDRGETPNADDDLKSRDRSDERTPDNDEADPTEEPDDGDDRSNGAIDGEFLDLGVVAEGEYISPQYGSELLWDDTWALHEEADEPVGSDTDDQEDFINLVWGGDGLALLGVDLIAAEGITPADMVEVWTSEPVVGDTGEVVLEDSDRNVGSVVIRETLTANSELVVVREVHLLDDGETLGVILYLANPAIVEDSLSEAQDGVELDGQPVLSVFEVEDVIEAVE